MKGEVDILFLLMLFVCFLFSFFLGALILVNATPLNYR